MNLQSVYHGNIEQNTCLIDIATRNVSRLSPDESVGKAACIMAEKRISSIVITDEAGHPLGIVTERNMLHAMQAGYPAEIALGTVMSSPVITVPESMSCLDAYQICLRDGIRHLVIVDDSQRLLGVVSETDFRLHINLAALAGQRQIGLVMSHSVFSMTPQASLHDALNHMHSRLDTCVVVVEDGCPVGIITERDIVRLYSRNPERTGIPLREVMNSPVFSIKLDSTINDAAERMIASRVRHLVVVDDKGRVAGLLSEHDLTRTVTLGLIDDKLIADGMFLRTLVNTLPDMIWLKDVNGAYLACNSRFEHFSGAREKDIIGKTDEDFLDSDLANSFREHEQEVIRKGKSCIKEEWVTYANDGHRELVEIIKTPMHDAQGKLTGVVTIAHNITKRITAEKAMQESNANLAATLQAIPDLLFELGANGEYINIWAHDSELLATQKAILLGHTVCEMLPANAADTIMAALKEAAEKNFSHGHVICLSLAQGDCWFELSTAVKAATDASGKHFIMMSRDITERKKAEQQLHQSNKEKNQILESTGEGIFGIDINGRCTFANSAASRILGYEISEMIGQDMHSLIHHHQSDQSPLLMSEYSIHKALQEGGHCKNDHEVFWNKDKTQVPVEYLLSPLMDEGKITGAVISFSDITLRKQAEIEFKIAATVFESQEGMIVTDPEGNILRVNRAFTKITGYTAEEVIGKTPRLLKSGRHDAAFYAVIWESVHRKGAWGGEIWNRRKNGEIYPERLTITAVKNSESVVTHYVSTLSDITLTKAAEDEIKHLAFYDPLTRLPNRRLLLDRLRLAMISSMRTGQSGSLLFIDLDNFKIINDTLGHDIGDMLLQQVANRLETCVREGDTVARLGGDEFVVMLKDLSEHPLEAATHTETIGNKILYTLNLPYQLAERNYLNSPSIGATLFNDKSLSIEELMKQADIAMYQAKKDGRNILRFFDPQMQETVNTRATLEGELRKAIEKRQFQLLYQIQVDGIHENGLHRPSGAEALIRWVHSERGLIYPAEFIPLAEETGLILGIGQWLLEEACAQINAWQKNEATRNFNLAVNVSAKQFRQSDFVAQVRDAMARHSVNPNLLKLELTESLLLEDIEDTITKMNDLNRIGVRFSLDDFGTGYSSLQYLKRLPLHQLKIDQSFVCDIACDDSDREIVRTIIAMAQNLSLNVIAEGVETEEQLAFLLASGCTHYQGYLFGSPMPIDQFDATLGSCRAGMLNL